LQLLHQTLPHSSPHQRQPQASGMSPAETISPHINVSQLLHLFFVWGELSN
jgi:hypothetical protein